MKVCACCEGGLILWLQALANNPMPRVTNESPGLGHDIFNRKLKIQVQTKQRVCMGLASNASLSGEPI
jgi:hypothetical protein